MSGKNTKEIKGIEPEEQALVPKEENTAPVVRKRGRPPGSKNKDTIFKELMQDEFRALAENKVPKVLETLFQKALDGDMQAIKMVMDRIVPAHKAIDGERASGGTPVVKIMIGNLEESPLVTGEIIEDVDYTEVDDATG
jgi:hypothetical protein